jgi:glycine dehydrogenase subunit 1
MTMRYLPHTPADLSSMLAAIGASSVDALFTSIPPEARLNRPLKLPEPLDEASLTMEIEAIAKMNSTATAFLGAGAYPHHVPAIVNQLLLRSEFYTAYTPYQPEMSQGTLQAIFEYQTLVCLLTATEVANASMYDGATGAAEAALMALRLAKGRHRILVGRNVHPEYRRVLHTYLAAAGTELVEVPFDASGRLDQAALRNALDGDTAAAVICGYPNYFGVVEDLPAVAAATHANGALLITATTESVAFGLLQGPGSLGADICVGEMQSFGNGVSFGGPGLGFFATREESVRQMPGRLCGATVDRNGKRGFVLTLSTREQHIRRERATSNICTNHGLNALAAAIHLAVLGKSGLHRLALLNYQRARYLRESLASKGIAVAFKGPTFNEFVVTVPKLEAAISRAQGSDIVPGLPLADDYPELANGLLICATEMHSKEKIDALVGALAG